MDSRRQLVKSLFYGSCVADPLCYGRATATEDKGHAMTKPRVTEVDIESLIALEANPRVRDERASGAIRNSVEAFGAARSIVADGDGVIRAGNGTLEQAKAAGITRALVIETDGKQVVVVKRPDWTPAQAMAYAISDNRASDLSQFDYNILGTQLLELQDTAPDIWEATGFTQDELDALSGPVQFDMPPSDGTAQDEPRRLPDMMALKVTAEQWEVMERACKSIKLDEGDDISTGRCLELICADYLAGTKRAGQQATQGDGTDNGTDNGDNDNDVDG